MDENPEDQLKEKIKHCLETGEDLEETYGCIHHYLQSSTCTPGDSEHSVKTTIVDDENGQLILDTRNRIDRALQLIQQQLKLALEEYLHTQSALPTSDDCSTIQSDDNHQIQGSNVTNYNTINQQVVLSDDNNGQIEAKLNPAVPESQANFTGTLPDDFYLHLISVMCIQECLLSNRLVCSLWNELVLERFHNQKSLKLFETFDRLMKYGEYLLKYEKTEDPFLILKPFGDDLLFEQLGTDHMQLVKSLDPEVILTREKKQEASKVLTSNFPKVEQLVLCPSGYDTLINIEHILQFYSKQLTSLTLTKFGSWNDSPGRKLRAFSFPMLKTLNTFNFSPEDGQLLSLLPQLESLTLQRSVVITLETFLRTGTQLQELNIRYIQSVFTVPVGEFSKRPPIRTNLRKFSFNYTEHELQILELISHNLTSLECLKMKIWHSQDSILYLHSLTIYLVPLHQLHSLTLQIRVSFFTLDDNQLAEIQPLPSVRHLKLLLSDNASLSSIERFSRALFAAFPNVEQVLIAFVGNDGRVDAATIAAFEDFARKHPTVVQLFRSKKMSKFTNLPNAVSPLLGHHRQVYDEYIEEEELFGVAICKLAASLVTGQGEDHPNLKITLRPADRLTALSNLLQLLESKAFTFLTFFTESNFWMVDSMLEHLVECALKYGPSEGALFVVTCKCVLIFISCILDCSEFKNFALSNSFGDAFDYFKHLLQMIEHYQKQQFKDKDLLLLIHNSMDKLIKEMLKENDLDDVMRELIQTKNRVHRVETVHAFLRFCENIDHVSSLFP